MINNITSMIETINKGDFTSSITANTQNKTLMILKDELNKMGDSLVTNVGTNSNKILDVLDKYAHNNFTSDIENSKGKVEIAINSLSKVVNKMLYVNKENGLTLDKSSDTLIENVDLLSVSSHEAAASLEETAAAVEEITSNARSTNENVVLMATYANELTSSSTQGKNLATQTTVSMDEINEQVQAITEAITVIDQIAFQTNILSLNATYNNI